MPDVMKIVETNPSHQFAQDEVVPYFAFFLAAPQHPCFLVNKAESICVEKNPVGSRWEAWSKRQ